MKAIHIAVGNYTLCGRWAKRCLTTKESSEATCIYCKSGGISPHKMKLKIIKSPESSEEQRFSLEDMEKCWDAARDYTIYYLNRYEGYAGKPDYDRWIKSYKPLQAKQ